VNNKQKSSLKYKVDKKKKLDSIIKISTGISDYGSKFIYNSDGYLTTETTIYRENSDKWNICCKYEYSYNDERNVILKILNFWNQNDNQWGAPKYKEEYIYNTQGNLAKMLKYDGGVNEEDLHSTYEYSYNSEEKLISISQYAGNTNNFRDKLEYTYSTQGYVTLIDDLDWNSDTNQFEINHKYEYTYDTNGNMIQESTFYKNLYGQWIESDKLEYTYDTNSNAISYFEYWGSPLELRNKQEYNINLDLSSSDLIMPPNWMEEYVEENRLNGWNYPNDMMTNFLYYEYVDQNWEERGETTLYYSDVSSSNIICENLSITNTIYPETDDLSQKVKDEFGDEYSIADWNDIKNISNIDDWVVCMGLKHDDTFMVTRDGNYISSGNRQYYVHYSTDGVPYSGFAVHDKVGDFYLGSWYGISMNILAKNGSTLATEDFKTEFFDFNDNKVPDGWIFKTMKNADISNGRINVHPNDGGANLTKEGIVPISTKEIILEMDAYIAYSYWGLISYFQIYKGDKLLQFRTGEEDYDHPTGNIANAVLYREGSNDYEYLYEALSPTVTGVYHLKLIMNDSGYEFIGVDPNGIESFRIHINPDKYFGFNEIDKIRFSTVSQTDNSGWIDNLKITVSDSQSYLGVDDELLAEGLNLYPNPVSDNLTIDSKLQLKKVEIYSILGQRIKEFKSGFKSISTGDLSSGIYIVRMYSEKGTAVKKLIKQ
jgi:hypothetical protein